VGGGVANLRPCNMVMIPAGHGSENNFTGEGFSSERAPHINKHVTVTKILTRSPDRG
jgi:hypothetical protein